ncbi:hypothetical protein NVP2275O_163 [Vibrio phage 2.275.O._10N.286.54.E11]|nr:hypothetical protein NVP2275O_163 [Vibrio phage 2.275.O._10N.286.54.E11]
MTANEYFDHYFADELARSIWFMGMAHVGKLRFDFFLGVQYVLSGEMVKFRKHHHRIKLKSKRFNSRIVRESKRKKAVYKSGLPKGQRHYNTISERKFKANEKRIRLSKRRRGIG